MSFRETAHAVEAEVVPRHAVWVHGRSTAFLIVAPINPTRGWSVLVRWRVVVKHAFRGVQDLVLLNSKCLQLLEHVLEIAIGRLVRSNVLSNVDCVELI